MGRGQAAKPGDTRVSKNGYHYTKVADRGWVLTHWLVAEEHILKRQLRKGESVRFRSGNKRDLSPENLYVVQKGTSNLRQRKAQIEARMEELRAELAEINKALEI